MKNTITLLMMALLVFASCSKEELYEAKTSNNLVMEVSSNKQTGTENQLMAMINEHRTTLGLQELVFEEVSYYYAGQHTAYMISKDKASHDNFNARAQGIAHRTGAQEISENVAEDYDSIEEAFAAWLNSPGHRKNIEGPYTHSAISLKANDRGKLFFTQIFFK